MKSKTTLYIFIVVGVVLFTSFYNQAKKSREYFKPEFSIEQIRSIKPRLIHFEDTIPNDTIYICFAENEYPYAYFREVFTTVCDEGSCLPVWLNIYWSPGGEYIGYRIKKNGILTKQKHTPFDEEDYFHLQNLLDDPLSILRNYQISDLVIENHSSLDSLDGISGATRLDVEDYVIKGAVYTTYTLWHTVYGASLDSIRTISSEYLSISFLESLIASPFKEDVLYALYILDRFDFVANEAIILKLADFIGSDVKTLSERSIDALLSCGKSDSLIQNTLSSAFNESTYSTKLRILRILNNYSYLLPYTVEELLSNLPSQSGEIINKILKLLQGRVELQESEKLAIAELLIEENRFISRMAYDYLSSLDNNEEDVIKKMREYANTLELN